VLDPVDKTNGCVVEDLNWSFSNQESVPVNGNGYCRGALVPRSLHELQHQSNSRPATDELMHEALSAALDQSNEHHCIKTCATINEERDVWWYDLVRFLGTLLVGIAVGWDASSWAGN
jgi:hypothetical protein